MNLHLCIINAGSVGIITGSLFEQLFKLILNLILSHLFYSFMLNLIHLICLSLAQEGFFYSLPCLFKINSLVQDLK